MLDPGFCKKNAFGEVEKKQNKTCLNKTFIYIHFSLICLVPIIMYSTALLHASCDRQDGVTSVVEAHRDCFYF